MSLDLTDDKSTLVPAWCRQATNHYLRQWWPRSLPPYGITRPRWVKNLTPPPPKKKKKICSSIIPDFCPITMAFCSEHGQSIFLLHYNDVIMGTIASQITSLTILFIQPFIQTQIKENFKALRHWPLYRAFTGNSPHKWPVTRKMCPFDDVIMLTIIIIIDVMKWKRFPHSLTGPLWRESTGDR